MTLNLKDFATGIVVTAPVPSNSGLTITLQAGEGARMPAVPFWATAHPATEMPTLDNAEEISVTDVTGDVLTIVRAQGETTAKSIAAGWRISNSLFKSDIDSLDLPDTPINPSQKYLNGNREWSEIAIGSAGYAANIYLTNINSSVSGYKVASYINDVSETIISKTVNNNELLIYNYLFDQALETTTIDSGTWKTSLYSAIDAAAGDSYFKFEIFVRHTDNTETTLFSAYSSTIENRTGYEGYQRNEITSVQPGFTVVATDKIGVKIYAKTTAAGERTLYYKIGDGNASYVNTPLSIRHTQLRGLNDDAEVQHLTSAQVTKLDGIATGATNNTKATGAEVNTGTDDVKFATAKAIKDSDVAFLTEITNPATSAPSTPYTGQLWWDTDDATSVGGGEADTLDGSHATDFYPVGTIYSNKTNSANPSTYLPGQVGKTWIAVEGVVVVGKAASGTFATAGSTGGEETHAMTAAENGPHTHDWIYSNTDGGNATFRTGVASSAWTQAGAISVSGLGTAHNNLQPYVVAYVWERTA